MAHLAAQFDQLLALRGRQPSVTGLPFARGRLPRWRRRIAGAGGRRAAWGRPSRHDQWQPQGG